MFDIRALAFSTDEDRSWLEINGMLILEKYERSTMFGKHCLVICITDESQLSWLLLKYGRRLISIIDNYYIPT